MNNGLIHDFPTEKYDVLYADPPWKYNNKTIGNDQKAGANHHYHLLNLQQIKELKIKEIIKDDCVLFLWAVVPQLSEAFEVMKFWGFKYKTMITWHKQPKNRTQALGYWFRGYTEHLLFGVRGKIKPFKSLHPNIIALPTIGHSRKPNEFRQLIENHTNHLTKKLELFAREKFDGWDSWGNEIESNSTLHSGDSNDSL